MNAIFKDKGPARVVLKWMVAAAFIATGVVSGVFSGLTHRAGLSYIGLGSVALALMGFSGREIGSAFRAAAGRPMPAAASRKAAVFWESASRNAWLLGVLGSLLNFTVVLGIQSANIESHGLRMVQSLILSLYGLVLAVVFLIPALKIMNGIDGKGPCGAAASTEIAAALPDRSVRFSRALGYVLFAAVLASTLHFLMGGQPQNGPIPLGKVLLHGPALLVVAGGTVLMALFVRAGARGLTLGFAVTGFISLLMGFIQALFGFMHRSIGDIVSAMAFIISSASFALLGLLVVAAPLEDREVMEGRRERHDPFSRFAWIVFPLLAFIFLVIMFIMVITPMQKPAGG
jgi:hypothetical protein